MQKIIAIFLVVSISLLYCGNVIAEIIHLKDGSITKGEIIETLQDSIKVKTKFGEITIPKSDIEKVEYDKKDMPVEVKESSVYEKETKNMEYERLKLDMVGYQEGQTTPVYFLSEHPLWYSHSTSLKWKIVQGKYNYLSDEEFARVIGDELLVEQIKEKRGEFKAGSATLYGLAGAGLGFLSGLSISYSNVAPALVMMGVGAIIGIIVGVSQEPEHYISPQRTEEKINKYNLELKIKLGLL